MLSSGLETDNLTVTYESLGDSMRATIVNLLPEPFEYAQVRFRVPNDGTHYQVEGGTLQRVLLDGSERVFYVSLPVPASGNSVATLIPYTISDAVGVPVAKPALGPAFPNPFNPTTTIPIEVPRAGPVRLAIYDAAGRHIRLLLDSSVAAGASVVQWDGRTDSGRDVPSGSYWVRMTGSAGEHQTRVVVVR